MKRLLILLSVALFYFYSISFANGDKWQIEKSTHFIIHYQNAQEPFIRQLSEKAEEYYNAIADDLGFIRFNFWLWDNRANIFVYDTASGYQAGTGQPAWSAGASMPGLKAIYTYVGAENFFTTVLPHEIGHIIFREFVGFDNPAVPVWLEEGVASYEMETRMSHADELVSQAKADKRLMSIQQLSGSNPQMMFDTKGVSLYYAEAANIVNYLVSEFGKDSFVLFCQSLRDKKDLNRAIASAYPFENIEQLNAGWQEHIGK
jgi:hypothetical protein